MDSYTHLLEKIRVPQPSLQKFAVISIFSKLRSSPTYLDPDSHPGREAITQCLHSSSPAVVDQTVRELCRLVFDSKLNLPRGLLELQSALQGADSKFVGLFVKGLGFLIRLGFERNNGSWHFASPESHPFVKILSYRSDVQSELVQQVLQFMAQNKRLGMVEVCEFLRPFLNFSVLRIPFSDPLPSLFSRQLISSMASFCCSFPIEAIPVLKLLMESLKLLPHKNSDELRDSYYSLESVVDAYTVVLRHLAQRGLLLIEAQLLGVELSDIILSLLTSLYGHSADSEPIIELVKRLFLIQKDLNMCYIPELSSSVLSLFTILVHSELEHEQLSVLKLLVFLFKWKSQNEYSFNRIKCSFSEELLFTFPVISLMSSTSRSVKDAAADLLLMLEKLVIELFRTPRTGEGAEVKFPSISSPGSIFYRLLRHLWSQDQFSESTSFFVNFSFNDKTDGKSMHHQAISWASQLRESSLRIIDRRKSSLPISQSQENFLKEMPSLLCAITALLVAHESLGKIALDMLATIGILDPKQGVPLLLAVLFYSNIVTKNDIDSHDLLPKLLAMLPSLASHFVMMPLIIQSILPMLQKNGKPVLYATGVRLLCQTWSTNDRAFGSLQAVLLPKGFTQFKTDKTICISLATSIRDVCRKNPDRGVDIILSVSACIESQDPIIKALGLQSLAHLCEADLIDFYTAWSVVEKHVVDYSSDAVVAQSVCTLLKWGAMDAEAYPRASENVLQILWDVGASVHVRHVAQWAKARACAFEALSQYEVQHIEKGIPEFKRKNMDLLFCETYGDVLKAMEGFQVKIITHEHMNRRRLVKERKVTGNKIEKLLDVFPQVLFPSGKKSNAGQLPGAALLCLSFSPKDANSLGISRVTVDLHAAYENALVEIASSLQLSRNIFVALLSLQSWKTFMRRWMRANNLSLDSKVASALDKTSESANNILKSMMRLAEESIPRSAENIALAVGALCLVLPSSAHNIKSAASKFLLNWLSQYEHEHRQWSAAISLGLISSCLHVTDHKQKFQNVTGLIEVLRGSKSTLVKGACGVGLGFSCQDLLTRVEAADSIDLVRENYKMLEVNLLGKIVRTLLLMTSQLSQASYDILEDLSPYFPSATDDFVTNVVSELLLEKCDDLEEDIWGVAGLILGLGSSVGAIYRAGAHDAVLKIKDLIISWIPHVDSVAIRSGFSGVVDKVLSVGSCLALPIIVAFCQRMEMMNDNELDHLVNGYTELITELVSVKKSGNFHQSLLMASCIGAGNLIACISNESVHPIEAEHIKGLLELFRKCYSNPYPALIHLGGMLGVVNAMGASAGILFHAHHFSSPVKTVYEQKKSSYVLGPLLSNATCEPQLTALVQDIFLVAQNSDDLQMRQNAAWAVSFLRNHLWAKELQDADNSVQNNASDSRTVSHSFPEDSIVLKLSLWLMHLNFSVVEGGTVAHVATIATVLRCLSRSPRLPTMDWGSIIRRCMRYESIFKLLTPESGDRGILREECLRFSITHANQFDPLLALLDELSDLSRFRMLELNLQTCLLEYLTDLTKIFSGSRLEKLFHDISEFFSSDSLNQMYNSDQKTALRISCWKGLCQCLDEASLSSLGHLPNTERCMEVLFSFLPALESTAVLGAHTQEWYEMVRCLEKAPGEWLSHFLQVPLVDLVQGRGQFDEVQKKVVTKAKLVKIGSIPLNELGGLKVHILNSKSHGIWNLLTEVVAALQHAEGSVKRQWLLDAVEISCESSFPSTSLQFVGLLSGSCCKYMPLLTLDPLTVLCDLSVTLTSLLKEPNWEVVAESIVSHLCRSTERIYRWVTNMAVLCDIPNLEAIDESEKDVVALVLPVMHHACLSLKEYLPLEKQLRLTNMNVKRFKLLM
ncbi:protein RST1 isoform X2 [Euphorbia lathyris]|uniref:protein RST1 isoform X2 n=1 Tax=Euphorbia lathyris TaxID=212925 RepID=UPI0033134975